MKVTWEDATEGEIDDQAQGGPAELVEDTKSFVAAFPDIHVQTLRVIAQGDLVAIEWRGRGTYTGTPIERGGVVHQPTGRSFVRDGVGIARIRDGKVVFYRDPLRPFADVRAGRMVIAHAHLVERSLPDLTAQR